MKKNKSLKFFIPLFTGLLVVFILLYIFTQIVNKVIYPGDGDQPFEWPILPVYTFFFIPTYIIASLFQYLVALKIWRIYNEGKKIGGLKSWQLLLISSLAFGSIIGYWYWDTFQEKKMLLFYIASLTLMSICYWTTNLLIKKFIDKKLNDHSG
ncbi:MAG: hypothetical protein ABIY51_10005 [Ferruginibacter sp.]